MGLLNALGLTAPKALGGGAAKAASGTAPPSARIDVPQLLARHGKLKADLDRIIGKGGKLAESLRQEAEKFRNAVAAKALDEAAKVLDRLEEIVWIDTGKASEVVPEVKGGAAPADPDDAALAEQMETISDYLGSIPDDKLKAKLVADYAALDASHDKARGLADAKKRSAALKAAMPPVKALLVKASQLAMQVQEKRFVADAQAEVEAMVSQVTALVLGGITADGPRKIINDELTRLKASVAKAAKVAVPKAAMAAWNAVKPAARSLIGRAEAAAGASYWADGQLKPLIEPVKTAIAGLAAAGPKGVLTAEMSAIEAEIERFKKANDVASLQALIAPRLQKLHRLATGLAQASAKADAELDRADKLIAGFDAARSVEIRASLKTLQDQKKASWPAGGSVQEIDAGAATFEAAVRRLIGEAEVLKLKLDTLKEIDALRAQVTALKPRTDKASEAPVPVFVEKQQKEVRGRLAAVLAEFDKEDLKKSQAGYASLVAALGKLEKFKETWEKYKEKLAAAKAGEIKKALDLKLLPPALAVTRTKAINKGEADIEALAQAGYPTPAMAKIDEWIVSAKAWAGAKEAYDLMHSDHPTAAGLEKLSKAPGGGPVLDALVADLPDDIPQEVLTEAVKARYGITVKQYDHQTDADTGATRTAANPKTPDKALKGLYSVLGKVPLKDTSKVKNIDRYTEESGGAAYGGGDIDLYCGRPDDGEVQEFNKKGEVMPDGQKVDKNCEPVNPKVKVSYFDFATLHEVGHAVDDKKKIMVGSRKADAGWEAPTASDIAALAAGHFHYDQAYLEAMVKSKKNVAPTVKPPPPAGVEAADWDLARTKAEDWVTSIRVTANLWWHAGDCARLAIGGRVYQESYAGSWVSYKLSARAQGITGYQFRSPMEWFAELYAAFFMKKLNPKHPAAAWLSKLKSEAN
jgi:hypothetical protein